MRVVIAPDSFKGSVTAAEVAHILAREWISRDSAAELVLRPMADGGEGTVAAFELARPDSVRTPIEVQGPTGQIHRTSWLFLPETVHSEACAVIDLASTSGIELLEELRPWDADSTGFGEAIAAALAAGVQKFLLGIGSSASTDGGIGMLRALGATITDDSGASVAPGAQGLLAAAHLDRSGLWPTPDVTVLSDVTNPLIGPQGAAAVFGPQKGLAQRDDQVRVDRALSRWAGLLGLDPHTPGAGAAGGVGAALLSWGARLVPGAEEIADLIGLDEAIAGADLVITGEGAYDSQSARGKVPSYVLKKACAQGVPVVLIAGRIDPGAELSSFARTISLTELAGSQEAAVVAPQRWLASAVRQLVGDAGFV